MIRALTEFSGFELIDNFLYNILKKAERFENLKSIFKIEYEIHISTVEITIFSKARGESYTLDHDDHATSAHFSVNACKIVSL
jgi:hypothetical protein